MEASGKPVADTEKTVSSSQGVAEIDLLDLIMVYIKKWWLLGLISLAAAVLVYFGVTYFINRSSEKWSVSADIGFPGAEEWKYPDGSPFSAKDYISITNIDEVLKSDEAFASLNANKVRDGLTVEREYELNKENQKVWFNTYDFSVKAAAFSSKDQAMSFLQALINNIENRFVENVRETQYDSYLLVYDLAGTFEEKLAALTAEKQYIIELYDTWIESYGMGYKVNNKTIKTLRENANAAFSDTLRSSLENELKQRQYVYMTDSVNRKDEEMKIEIEIETLEELHEDNGKKINELYASLETLRKSEISGSADSSGMSNETFFYEEIAKLVEKQVDIERQISDMQTRLENIGLRDESSVFAGKLDSVREILKKEAETVTVAAIDVCKNNTYHVFDNAFKVSRKNAVLYAAAVFVVVYLLVGFIVFCAEAKKKAH